MDGVRVLGGILEINPQARVVMASSLGSKEKVLQCIERGAKSFITKPYTKEDLLTLLRQVADAPEPG